MVDVIDPIGSVGSRGDGIVHPNVKILPPHPPPPHPLGRGVGGPTPWDIEKVEKRVWTYYPP